MTMTFSPKSWYPMDSMPFRSPSYCHLWGRRKNSVPILILNRYIKVLLVMNDHDLFTQILVSHGFDAIQVSELLSFVGAPEKLGSDLNIKPLHQGTACHE